MMSRFTLAAALAASLTLAAQTALAGAEDYTLELVETTRPVGAGAILQVIIEVGALLRRRSGPQHWLSPPVAAGVSAGLAIMYGTALLV